MSPVSASILVATVLQTAPPPPPSGIIIEPVLYYASGSIRPLASNERNLASIRDYASRPGVTAVIIEGHADTLGSADANHVLSERRAREVAATLIADGVPPSLIQIRAYGETRLGRPTADGVDDPLNRRVSVGFSY
jgi:outer membrane protein OmpA-like peptidoglycan-associated protein